MCLFSQGKLYRADIGPKVVGTDYGCVSGRGGCAVRCTRVVCGKEMCTRMAQRRRVMELEHGLLVAVKTQPHWVGLRGEPLLARRRWDSIYLDKHCLYFSRRRDCTLCRRFALPASHAIPRSLSVPSVLHLPLLACPFRIDNSIALHVARSDCISASVYPS